MSGLAKRGKGGWRAWPSESKLGVVGAAPSGRARLTRAAPQRARGVGDFLTLIRRSARKRSTIRGYAAGLGSYLFMQAQAVENPA